MDDRSLLEAKYTAPSGKEFIFLWEKSFSKKTELKTGIFTFPNRDGAHVQHQGGGAVSYPITCIFNGDNHITLADEFEAALYEKEPAELQHPVYGIKKVIPTGDINRENDLINTVNETHITITFTETLTDEAASLEAVTADKLEESLDEFTDSAAADFAESLTIENVTEQLLIQSSLETQANVLYDNLIEIVNSDVKKNTYADFLTSMKELKNNIKSLTGNVENIISNGLNIARLTLRLMKMPSRITINITEKIKGYSQLVAQITNQFKNDPFGVNNIKNAFASTRLVLTGAVASISSGAALSIAESTANNKQSSLGKKNMTSGLGSSSSVLSRQSTSVENNKQSSLGKKNADGGLDSSSGVLSREAAIAVAVQLKDSLNTIQDFEDTKIEQNNFIDTNANTYLTLVKLVHDSINLILNVSFSLPMRRIIKLDRDRNIIELCVELYGSVDNYFIDRLIVENNFNIDDLEIIPMGREVYYYV